MMEVRLASRSFVLAPVMILRMCARTRAAFFCDIARDGVVGFGSRKGFVRSRVAGSSSQSSVSDDQAGQWRVLRALFDLTHYDPERRGDLVNKGCCLAVEKLSTTANVQARQCAAACLCYLSEHKPSRSRMVSDGAVDALVRAAEDTRANDVTKHWCAVALANLSAETEVSKGDVAALLNVTFSEVTSSPIKSNSVSSSEEAPFSPSGTLTRKMTTLASRPSCTAWARPRRRPMN